MFKATKNLVSAMSYMLSSNFLVLLIYLATTIVMARLLEPEQLGLLLAGEAFVDLFSFFFIFGFSNSMLKISAKHEDGMEAGLGASTGNALLIKAVLLLPSLLLVYAFAKFSGASAELMPFIYSYMAIAALDSFSRIFGIVRRALGQFKLISFINAFNRLLKLALIFILLTNYKDPLLLVYSFTFFSAIKFLISFFTTFRLLKITIDLSQIKAMCKQSFKFGVFDALDQMQTRIDRVMLQSLAGPAAVAFYSIPAKLNRLTRTIPNTVKQVFLPRLHEEYGSKKQIQDLAKFHKSIEKASSFLLLCGVGLFIFIFYFSEFILLKFFGAKYADSLSIVKLFAFINLIWFLDKTPNLILAVQGEHKKRTIPLLCSIGLNIVLNFIFIPQYGIVAAVYATLTANCLKMIFLHFLVAKDLQITKVISVILPILLLVAFVPVYVTIPLYAVYLFMIRKRLIEL